MNFKVISIVKQEAQIKSEKKEKKKQKLNVGRNAIEKESDKRVLKIKDFCGTVLRFFIYGVTLS